MEVVWSKIIRDLKVPVKMRTQFEVKSSTGKDGSKCAHKVREKPADCAACEPDSLKEKLIFKELPVKLQDVCRVQVVFQNIILFFLPKKF